jgi:hypothetical protein
MKIDSAIDTARAAMQPGAAPGLKAKTAARVLVARIETNPIARKYGFTASPYLAVLLGVKREVLSGKE